MKQLKVYTRFLYIIKDGIIPIQTLLGERYKLGSTVSGTRNNHYFSTTEIRGKHGSVDPEFYVYHSFSQSEENQHNQIIKSLVDLQRTSIGQIQY